MPRGGRTSGTRPKGNGHGIGGPARGAGHGGPAQGPKPRPPIQPGDARQGARADNGEPDEQAYRASRRARIRELRAFGENAQAEVIQKARAAKDLALQSQAADRLLARLPVEKLDDDAGTPANPEATVKIYLPERFPEPE